MDNLIGEDIKLWRARYDEALKLQGIPCKYQFPILPDTNEQGESVIDSYSPEEDTHIFFEGSPKVKTFKRFGWVVENNNDLPFIIHCSFNLQNVQRDSIFRIAGQYTELPERVFRVIEISYDLQAPDHLACQVVPVYEKQIVGRTKKEVQQTFNKSEHFIKQPIDYRGEVITNSTKYRRKGKPEAYMGNIIGLREVNSNMLKVTGSDIQLTRGDSGTFTIEILNPDGSKYIRQDGDELVFTLKENTHTNETLLQKNIDGLVLEILPTDTEGIKYGTYKYDVQLTTSTGQVFTVIAPSNFTLRSEVTF